jgi:F-type H+-transporting ATPase subunit delta
MAEQRVSTRYAESLLDSAIQKNLLDVISNDIDFVSSVLKQNPKLTRMLENPIIKSELKSSVLKEVFEKKINYETMEFLLFIIKKKREEILSSIVEKFKDLRDLKLGFVNIDVTVASEFSDLQKNELQSKLEKMLKRKARMNFRVDEKILGGFVVQAGDTIYNASIKHQLDLLREHFMEASLVKN